MRTGVRSDQRRMLLQRFAYLPGTLVELGVDWGVTTRILAATFPKNKILSIDNWDPKYHQQIMPDGEVFSSEDKYQSALRIVSEYDNVTIVRADIVTFGKTYTEAVSGIFFDAAHEEDLLLAEFAAWLPHVSKQGVVLVHDANREGVSRACDKVFTGHQYVRSMCVWDRREGGGLRGA